jgi:hypothetical protein
MEKNSPQLQPNIAVSGVVGVGKTPIHHHLNTNQRLFDNAAKSDIIPVQWEVSRSNISGLLRSICTGQQALKTF